MGIVPTCTHHTHLHHILHPNLANQSVNQPTTSTHPQDPSPRTDVNVLCLFELKFDNIMSAILPQFSLSDINLTFLWGYCVAITLFCIPHEKVFHHNCPCQPALNQPCSMPESRLLLIHLLQIHKLSLCEHWGYPLALNTTRTLCPRQHNIIWVCRGLIIFVCALKILPGVYLAVPSDLDLKAIFLLSFPKYFQCSYSDSSSFSLTLDLIHDIIHCIVWASNFPQRELNLIVSSPWPHTTISLWVTKPQWAGQHPPFHPPLHSCTPLLTPMTNSSSSPTD